MIKTIIFDFGGVMAPRGTLKQIGKWYSSRYGINESTFHDVVIRYWKQAKINAISSDEFWKGLSKDLHLPLPVLRQEMISLTKPDRKMIDLVQSLSQKFPLALLSNHIEDWLEEIIHIYGFRHVFSVITTSYQTGLAKPDRKMYEIVAAKLGMTYGQCLFIDDKMQNIIAAETVGMKTILFTDIRSLRKSLKAFAISGVYTLFS